MITVIDNYDSFTYNLVQYLGELGAKVRVFRNDAISIEELKALESSHVVISPGPGTPDDAGISKQVIRELGPNCPILGVCLGHQCIGEVFGGRVVRAPRLMHGKTSQIHHDGEALFAGLPAPFEATRYHSLIVEEPLPEVLERTASTEQGELMGLRHRTYPIFGVQFHPESILTPTGKRLLQNFLEFDPITVERATAQDLEEILSLQKLAFRSEAERYDDFTLPPMQQTLEDIEEDFEKMVFLKASTGKGKIVGSVRAYADGDTCFIARLAVHPEFQRRGIGTRLMRRIESHFNRTERFELFTGDRSLPALNLYRKLGYEEFKRKPLSTYALVFLEKVVRPNVTQS